MTEQPTPPGDPLDESPGANGVIYIIAGVFAIVILAVSIFLLLDVIGPDDLVIDLSDTSPNEAAIVLEGVDPNAGTVIDPPTELQDFTFTANTGDPLSLSDLRGSYVLIYFGYTHCPDVCPLTLLDFRRIKRDLGDVAEGVEFVLISVDGERDTPEFLDRYIARYDSSFIGLSGDDRELERIAPDYNLFYERRENVASQAGYLVDHTSSKFLVDPDGHLIRIYSFTVDAEVITGDLRELLNGESESG